MILLKKLEMFVEEAQRLYSPHDRPSRRSSGEIILGRRRSGIQAGAIREWNREGLQEPIRVQFNPFGGGPGNCVAQAFPLTELKLILAMLVQRFSFRLSPSYRHEPVLRMNLQPKFGVQVVLERVSSI